MLKVYSDRPRIVWVTRSFLDYRIPVYEHLDELVGHNLFVIFSKDYVPEGVCTKIENALGSRAIGVPGEWKLGPEDRPTAANAHISVRFHPHLMKIIAGYKPDVLVGDGFFKWTAAAFLYKLLHRTPLAICYERTFHTERNAQWYRIAYRKFVMRWIDAMCCNGKLCGEYVQSLGFPTEKTTFGHMVADTTGLQNSASKVTDKQVCDLKSQYRLKGTVFLYIGQLSSRKGLIELLNGWKVFTSSVSADEATLFLVGDGPQRQECEGFCSSNSLRNVRFAGAIDYDELAPYYMTADAFVIPTLEDNWSLVVPEAMACGLPILCSEYNGCWPELVHNGENGWVFDPLDIGDTVQGLRVCMENADRLREMGERSRVIVGNHTPVQAAESILRACEIAIARH